MLFCSMLFARISYDFLWLWICFILFHFTFFEFLGFLIPFVWFYMVFIVFHFTVFEFLWFLFAFVWFSSFSLLWFSHQLRMILQDFIMFYIIPFFFQCIYLISCCLRMIFVSFSVLWFSHEFRIILYDSIAFYIISLLLFMIFSDFLLRSYDFHIFFPSVIFARISYDLIWFYSVLYYCIASFYYFLWFPFCSYDFHILFSSMMFAWISYYFINFVVFYIIPFLF